MDTIGNLIDKLTIANIRVWMAEDVKRDSKATDKQIADACRTTNVANQHRTDLIQEIDERLNDISEGKKQKLYKQGESKMYGKT
jgi:predicted outer membrane protein